MIPGSATLRLFAVLALALLTLLASGVAVAHSEIDKALFVANGGVDEGRCLDARRPCASIGYALRRVGKGGQIRVATGRFELTNVGDIFHLVSGLVDVHGGLDRGRGFKESSAAPSTLIGVPEQYREGLARRGFHIISDRKSLDKAKASATEQLFAVHQGLQSSMTTASCDNGSVNGMACDNTVLLSHVSFSDVSSGPTAASDVWGFVDLNSGREYAIVGYNNGTAVFDVTDAGNPREVGFVFGQDTSWRDIKVYQHFNATEARWNAYAYVTTDGSADGLFVIDLTQLPQRISRLDYTSDFTEAHNVYALDTDFSTGLSLTGAAPSLIIAGSNNGGGGFRLYSLAAPASPGFVVLPEAGSNDYMHDASSIIIRDSRKDTQCVNAVDYCEVLFDFNETTIDIWDITEPATPLRLSRTEYENTGYTHSGWPSEDGQHLFVHDELDEQDLGMQTTLRTFSIADLTAPTLVGTWAGPTGSIDHNGFVRGNRYYMSNYSRGLTILDISDPTAVQHAGMLDTYPGSDSASFVGAWGAYPYFPSGSIAVSDMSSGFYLVGDETVDAPEGQISFTERSFGGAENEAIMVTVQRTGGVQGAVSVDLTLVPGTADASDIDSQVGTLSWADGDAATKTVAFNTALDGDAEGLERMLLKLAAPIGGATLAPASIASLYIGDTGDTAAVEFDVTDVTVGEDGFNTAVVVLQRRGSATGEASVDYALSNASAIAGVDFQGATTGTVSWGNGDADPKWIEFQIADDGQGEADEFFELSLTGSSGAVLGSKTVSRITIIDNDPNADSDSDGNPDISDTDDDNDGMTDEFESYHSLDPLDASDAGLDPDNDGLSNLEEFIISPEMDPYSPDTDGDGLQDNLDESPVSANALCDGEVVVLDAEVIADSQQCAAAYSVTITGSTSVLNTGTLAVFSPQIGVGSGLSVDGRIELVTVDPCPACP